MDGDYILETLTEEFPGLLDHETDVNGGDLVGRLSELLTAWDKKEKSTT